MQKNPLEWQKITDRANLDAGWAKWDA